MKEKKDLLAFFLSEMMLNGHVTNVHVFLCKDCEMDLGNNRHESLIRTNCQCTGAQYVTGFCNQAAAELFSIPIFPHYHPPYFSSCTICTRILFSSSEQGN